VKERVERGGEGLFLNPYLFCSCVRMLARVCECLRVSVCVRERERLSITFSQRALIEEGLILHSANKHTHESAERRKSQSQTLSQERERRLETNTHVQSSHYPCTSAFRSRRKGSKSNMCDERTSEAFPLFRERERRSPKLLAIAHILTHISARQSDGQTHGEQQAARARAIVGGDEGRGRGVAFVRYAVYV